MAIDVKKIAEQLVSEIQKNPDAISSLMSDPVKYIEKKTGVDLPDDQVNKVISAVKTKLTKSGFDAKDLLSLAANVATKKSTKTTTSKKSGIDADDIANGISAISKLLKK